MYKRIGMKKGIFLLALLWQLTGFGQESLSKTFYFKTNAYELSNAQKTELLHWLQPHLKVRGVEIKLISFTDTVGPNVYNDFLSEKRLKQAQQWLESNEITILEAISMGENYPLTSYTTNAKFRKLEIHVTFATRMQSTTVAPKIKSLSTEKLDIQRVQPEEEVKERMAEFAKEDQAVRLKIEFVGGQDLYIGNSEQDVILLADYLEQNPTKTAHIRGHVCCFNDLPLSILRAKAVYRDLVYLGIDPSRLSYQGYGNTIPVAEEIDEESRQLNRRVDVIIRASN